MTGTWEPCFRGQTGFKLHLCRVFDISAQVPVTSPTKTTRSWARGAWRLTFDKEYCRIESNHSRIALGYRGEAVSKRTPKGQVAAAG